MNLKKELMEKITALERKLDEAIPRSIHEHHVTLMERRIKQLEEQNAELWKKLMARDLPEYETYREPELPALESEYGLDEGAVGEILKDETES